jgi:hypothetical protein
MFAYNDRREATQRRWAELDGDIYAGEFAIATGGDAST